MIRYNIDVQYKEDSHIRLSIQCRDFIVNDIFLSLMKADFTTERIMLNEIDYFIVHPIKHTIS